MQRLSPKTKIRIIMILSILIASIALSGRINTTWFFITVATCITYRIYRTQLGFPFWCIRLWRVLIGITTAITVLIQFKSLMPITHALGTVSSILFLIVTDRVISYIYDEHHASQKTI